MSLREILLRHPKGKEYGYLIEEFERFPLLVDSKNEVLSMPPIINSEGSGKITPETKNLFIDVTGFNQELIDAALKTVCMALADRGGRIESVEIHYGKKRIVTPSFKAKKIEFSLKELEEKSGIRFNKKQVIELLKKKRMNGKVKKNRVLVEFPDYRTDILHAVDIIEDLLIAFDYNKIEPSFIQEFTLGFESKESKHLNALRETCIGMGLQEILTFVLTSKEVQEKKVGLTNQEFVEIENPVSLNWSVFRKNLFPELLSFLAKNKHNLFPQRVFEIGKVVHLNEENETRVLERNRLCIASSHSKANFNEVKSLLQALVQAHGWKFKLEAIKHPSFEEGKCGALSINERKGIIGEIKESVLQNFGLEKKVAVLELEI
jgi:phenylalanyl-tRNA synthetase beta chain